ncbi:hypothetical protein Ae201684P_002162 [Aphanomyces euteiches]|nr:hypothetical protein Ae201684P_002162 [Aphanomyces euteiches]
MEQLIPIINKLQDVFSAIGQSPINLPQIVVVGSQSSGKSSVLENIVGKDFLPRGSGIVTRRPLVLQLYNTDGGVTKDEEWGEFNHLPNQKFHDFKKIREEIEKETDRMTGKNKGISNKPITLKVFSPFVLNLTLVDLPGPSANTDLANSDSLKMARAIDPEGQRTIGVLTKLDLMDDGTDAMEMLQGRVIPLKKGYVGIVNRSQADINNGVGIRDSVAKEQTFFKSHPAYRGIASRMGTQYLSKSLNTILMHHIRDCLPDIKSRISSMLNELDLEMDGMGNPTDSMSKTALGATLLQLISHFSSSFINSLDGRQPNANDMTELYGGARISYIFNELFSKSVQAIDPFDQLSDNDIRTTIRNANGPRQSLFVPEVSFELLAKRQIARLEAPGLQCVDFVFDELQRVTSQCETVELTRFADLRDRVVEVVNNMLRTSMAPTQTMITNLIKTELAYINTNHPDFIGGSRAVAQLMDKLQQDVNQPVPPPEPVPAKRASATRPPVEEKENSSGSSSGFMSMFNGKRNSSAEAPKASSSARDPVVKLPQVPSTVRQGETPTDRERIETEIIKSLLASYFDIVRKNFLDLVPKTIMCFMVNHAKDQVQNQLVSSLYKEEKLGELLRESGDIASRRANCSEMRTLLSKALDIVNEVRDFNTFK